MRSAVLWPKFSLRDGILTFAVLAGLIGLLWFSLHLGAMRVFQVDECRNVFVARLLAVKKAGAAPGTGSLHYRLHTYGTYTDDLREILSPAKEPVLAGTLDGKPLPVQPVELQPG